MKMRALLVSAGLCFAMAGLMSVGCDKEAEKTATTKPKNSRPKVVAAPKGGDPLFADESNTKQSK